MTPKQQVLAKYPNARYVRTIGNFRILRDETIHAGELGEGITEFDAWADAAKRLSEK